jgi:hypothetical protein
MSSWCLGAKAQPESAHRRPRLLRGVGGQAGESGGRPYALTVRGGWQAARHAALIVDFVDVVTRGEKGIEFRLEEFSVPEHSTIAERTIGDRTAPYSLGR